MSSPICLVNGSLTTNGVDVSDGAVVTIQLQNTAGVKQWSISCVATDDLNDKTGINSSLVVNYSTKNGSFTAPNMSGAGAAMIFESIINGGVDRNGKTDPSLRTRFGVFIPTPQGYRVAAVGERTEGNSVFGWTKKFNDLIRNYPSASGLVAANAGNGLVLSGNSINVVAADNSVVINPDSIAVNTGAGLIVNSNLSIDSAVTITGPATNTATGGRLAIRDSNGDIAFRNINLSGALLADGNISTGGSLINLTTINTVVTMATSDRASATANFQLFTGSSTSSGNTGSITISTGLANSGAAGHINILPGTGSISNSGNIALINTPNSWNNSSKVVFLGNCNAAPSAALTGGVFLYGSTGTFNLLVNGGTILTLGSGNFTISGNQATQGTYSIATANQATGSSRNISIKTGTSVNAGAGAIELAPGSSTGGAGGDIRLAYGTGNTAGNVLIGPGLGGNPGLGGAQGVIFIADAVNLPVGTTSATGGLLFVRASDGALCYKGHGAAAYRVVTTQIA